MGPEDKDLLLKDLSARLPYQIKVSVNGGKELWALKGMFEGEHTGMMLILEPSCPPKDVSPQTSNWQLSQCKPYLRPMSSMTEGEIIDFLQIPDLSQASKRFINDLKSGNFGIMANMSNYARNIDWLNKNMFDYRGLIPKDLALSTEAFNPYKDKKNETEKTRLSCS